MDNAGPDGAILKKYGWLMSFYRGEKSWGVYSFTGQGVVSQKPNDTSKKALRQALE